MPGPSGLGCGARRQALRKLGFIGVLILAMLSIQVGATFAKRLFPAVGPEVATLLRIWISALLLGVFWKPWRLKLNRQAVTALALYGASLGGMNLIFYLSIERIPLGLAVAIEFVG